MKKAIIGILTIAAISCITSCTSVVPQADTVTLSWASEKSTMYEGGIQFFSITATPDGILDSENIAYESSNTEVATVYKFDNTGCYLSGVKAGAVRITGTLENVQAVLVVQVEEVVIDGTYSYQYTILDKYTEKL